MSRIGASLHIVGTALGNRRIRSVLIAFLLFSVAEWVRWVGLLVYGFAERGPGGAGLISVVQLLPAALITPFTSSLADRYPRARVLTVAYVVSGMGTAGSGIAVAAGLPFAVVAVTAAVGACGIMLVRPTQASLLPELADAPAELTAANAFAGLLMAGSLFVGPALASAILALSGVTAVMLAGGAMLGVGAIFVVLVHRGAEGSRASRGRVDLLGGLRELHRDPGAGLVVGLLGSQAAMWGMVDVLIVSLSIRSLGLGTSGVGLLSAALGIGALAGGGATLVLVGRQRMAPSFGFGVVLWGVPLLFVGIWGVPVLVVGLLAAAGAGLTILDVAGRTLLQRTVSDEALGRVFGVLESGFMAAWAAGSAAAATIVHLAGIGWAFVLAGALVPLATAVTWSQLVKTDRQAVLPGPELDLLRSIEMFSLLSESVLERLARNLIPVTAQAGTLIVREGDPGDLFYVVSEGQVRVTISGAAVAAYGPGGFFGEIALLRDIPRQASVTAVTDVALLSLDQSHFLAAMTGSAPAARAAHSEIGRRLGSSPTDPPR